ncbi:MAG TPA: permease prefix domain 1-containing protein [Candidatus Acidoferrales bacterium]|nr:permease prefix domain 1-containing protein [Candidatus Acidoferrales bacterium]
MRDFTGIVRRNLGRLPLAPEREEEIVTELAQQLEDAYREAMTRGLPEARAEAEAMTQLGDWEKLRRSIVTSEKGSKVLWPHPWAVPRAVSWLALAIVAMLCLVPGFREALRQAPSAWFAERVGVTESTLRELAERGQRQHDARLVAFAALHTEDQAEADRLAEQAAAMDPSYTWVGSRLLWFRAAPDDSVKWAKRLIAWDPDNAVPRIFAAQPLFLTAVAEGSPVPKSMDPQLARLAEKTDWGRQMQAAFDAPRFDTYEAQRFELDRSVLRELEGENSKSLVAYASIFAGYPDLLQALHYGSLVTESLGPEAERAGNNDEAARMYWSVARFGQRLEESSPFVWNHMGARRLEATAYARLAALAERKGNTQEAAAVALLQERVERLNRESDEQRQKARASRWDSNERAAVVACVAAWLVMLSLIGCGFWAGLVAFRRNESALGGWPGALAMASSYAPGLLLGACAVLYSVMEPFLRSPFDFATRATLFEEIVPFWYAYWRGWDTFGFWRMHYIVQHMLWPVAASVIVLIAGMTALRWVGRTRTQKVQVE